MGTTTQTALRQAFLEAVDDWKGSLVVDSGAAAGATLVDTSLKTWDLAQDDFYNGWWVKITGGTYAGNERLVSDYTTATGTITPVVAFGGQLLVADTYEIMPGMFEPAKIRAALNEARLACYPYLYKKAIDEAAGVTGNWLWNSHFEDYTSGAFDHMALSTTPATMTQESTIIRGPLGTKAAKFASGTGSSYMYQSQVENPSLLDLAGQSIYFYAWAYCGTASKAKIEIYTKTNAGVEVTTVGSNLSAGTGTFHTGGSEYELLGVESLSIPEELSDIQFRWYNTAATAYFDGSYAIGPYNLKLHLPKQFAHDPDVIEYQIATGATYKNYADDIGEAALYTVLERGMWQVQRDATNSFIIFKKPLMTGRNLRITGRELLTILTSTEADTMEIANEEIRGLIHMAVSIFYDRMAAKDTGDDISRYFNLATLFKARAMESLRGPGGMKAPWNGIRRF